MLHFLDEEVVIFCYVCYVCWEDDLGNRHCLNYNHLMHLGPIVVVKLLLPEATEMLLLTNLINFLDLFRC